MHLSMQMPSSIQATGASPKRFQGPSSRCISPMFQYPWTMHFGSFIGSVKHIESLLGFPCAELHHLVHLGNVLRPAVPNFPTSGAFIWGIKDGLRNFETLHCSIVLANHHCLHMFLQIGALIIELTSGMQGLTLQATKDCMPLTVMKASTC